MELALLFIQGRGDPALGRESGGALAPEDVDEVLLAVRWRLVPGPIIAERVMAHPALVDDQMQIRPRLLCALADGMRFQLLGGKAWSTMAPSRAGRLRRAHRIPIKSFSSLAVGMAVRVIDDLSQLRQLCKRCAPGAKNSIGWGTDMRNLVGSTYTVMELDGLCCAALIHAGDQLWGLPFDALQLSESLPPT